MDIAPGVPMDRRPAKKRIFERSQVAQARKSALPRLRDPVALHPESDGSDIGDMCDFPGDHRSDIDESHGVGLGPVAAGPRGRGRGVGGGDGAGRGAAHPGDDGAVGRARGRGRAAGRGGRASRAPIVPRGSRQHRWGKASWSIGPTTVGWGADCRCHRNMFDADDTTHCKKNIALGTVRPLTMDEARRLCKVWLLVGDEIDHTTGFCRDAHVAVNPRHHYQGLIEAELDSLADAL